MTHGSLFSGIGGFDLAAQWMGWENVFHCEWNEFGQKVLKHYWPNAISYHDITKTDFTIHRGAIDILTGGFPCQPYSTAGKRLGKDDSRHLWPEMLRAIREIRPRWILGENVRGLISWNGGMVFDEVLAELENEGYKTFPVVLPAAGVNAPHRRERIWFVAFNADSRAVARHRSKQKFHEPKQGAHSTKVCHVDKKNRPSQNPDYNGRPSEQRESESSERQQRYAGTGDNERLQTDNGQTRNVTNTCCSRQQKCNLPAIAARKRHCARCGNEAYGTWQNFPTQSPVCSGDDGLPAQLDGITFSKWRNESIKAYGNAVVPQVVLQIFKAIQQIDESETI